MPTAAEEVAAAAAARAQRQTTDPVAKVKTGFVGIPLPPSPYQPPTPSTKGGRKTRRSRRLMSRKYCKKTPCRRMGFTQRASCRPYKNCYRK